MGSSSAVTCGPEAVRMNEQGEVAVPEPWRDRLDLRPGATLTLLPFGEGLLLLPEQTRLESVLQRIRARLAQTQHTPDDVLATLPEARARVFERLYGDPGDEDATA